MSPFYTVRSPVGSASSVSYVNEVNTMSTKKKAKKQAKNQQMVQAGQWKEPLATAASYMGPIRKMPELEGFDLHTLFFQSDGVLATSGAGALAPVFKSSPNSPGGGLGVCPGWTNATTIFQEARCLGFEVELVPVQPAASAPLVLWSVIDYANATALASSSNADAYSSCKNQVFNQYNVVPHKRIVRMNNFDTSQFTDITSGALTDVMWIKVWTAGGSVSTSYFQAFVRYAIQFRARGL